LARHAPVVTLVGAFNFFGRIILQRPPAGNRCGKLQDLPGNPDPFTVGKAIRIVISHQRTGLVTLERLGWGDRFPGSYHFLRV